MPRRPINIIERFRRSTGGATAVELALIAVPFIGIIFAIVQTAIIFFFDQALQTGTQKAGRQVMTGSVQTTSLTQQQFVAVVCANLPSEFNCANLYVDVQSSSAFSTTNTSPVTATWGANGKPATQGSFSPGNPGDIVILRVLYSWPVIGGPMGVGLSNQSNGGHLLLGTAVFKNEPYQ